LVEIAGSVVVVRGSRRASFKWDSVGRHSVRATSTDTVARMGRPSALYPDAQNLAALIAEQVR